MAEASEARDRVRSHFGPLERRGVLAGWRGGQIAAVAAGLVVAVGALRADPGIAGAAVAVVAVAGAGATASWPIAGRTAEQWLPLVARRAADLARGTTYVASPAPAGGGILVATGDGLACADPAHRARPARPSVAGWWRATGRGEGAGPFAAALGFRQTDAGQKFFEAIPAGFLVDAAVLGKLFYCMVERDWLLALQFLAVIKSDR